MIKLKLLHLLGGLLLLALLGNSCISAYQNRVPTIVQGGMGIRISSWQLAREVARQGELGVVSATGVDTVLVRTLQQGEWVPRKKMCCSVLVICILVSDVVSSSTLFFFAFCNKAILGVTCDELWRLFLMRAWLSGPWINTSLSAARRPTNPFDLSPCGRSIHHSI